MESDSDTGSIRNLFGMRELSLWPSTLPEQILTFGVLRKQKNLLITDFQQFVSDKAMICDYIVLMQGVRYSRSTAHMLSSSATVECNSKSPAKKRVAGVHPPPPRSQTAQGAGSERCPASPAPRCTLTSGPCSPQPEPGPHRPHPPPRLPPACVGALVPARRRPQHPAASRQLLPLCNARSAAPTLGGQATDTNNGTPTRLRNYL